MIKYIKEHCLITLGEHSIYYKKLKDKYKFLCSECGTTWYGTYQDMVKYRQTGMCPHCFGRINVCTGQEKHLDIAIYNEDTHLGYMAYGDVKEAKVKNIKYVLMFKTIGKQAYIKGYRRIYVNYYNLRFIPDTRNEWRKTGKDWEYYFTFLIANGKLDKDKRKVISYKEYLENQFTGYGELKEFMPLMKSNQKYLIQHNMLNPEMIKYMLQFNLNSTELLYKYHKYIDNYKCHRNFEYSNLNEKAFEYCATRLIQPVNYIDYRKNCDVLGIVDKYPKDFAERDYQINTIYQKYKDEHKFERCDKLIKKISLPKAQFKANKKKYYINQYHSASELQKDAKTFRNCIYNNYAEDYADRKTDLYRCVDTKGKLIACIEVHNGSIEQIMGKDNSKPKLYKYIRTALVEMVGA